MLWSFKKKRNSRMQMEKEKSIWWDCKIDSIIQLNPALTDFKGLIGFICNRRNSVFANIGNKRKLVEEIKNLRLIYAEFSCWQVRQSGVQQYFIAFYLYLILDIWFWMKKKTIQNILKSFKNSGNYFESLSNKKKITSPPVYQLSIYSLCQNSRKISEYSCNCLFYSFFSCV